MPSKEHVEVLRHLKSIGTLFATGQAGAEPYEAVRAAMNVFFTAPPLASTEVLHASLQSPRAEWILDHACDPERRMLFLHGGGYISGSIESHRNFAMWISRATGCAILLIDYRLAPEHPYPAAVEDALCAFEWMRENGPTNRSPAQKAFVIGDSAGGGLTLALLLALRDRKLAQADAAVTYSAWTDISNSSPSMIANQNEELGTLKAVVDYFSAQYLQGADARQPLASPLFARLDGLPPLLMQVSDSELVTDDSVRFAEKARAAGVRVELDVCEGLVHVWQGYVPLLPEATEALERTAKFIRSV